MLQRKNLLSYWVSVGRAAASDTRGSNLVIGNFFTKHAFTVEKTKTKKKEAGNGPLYNKSCIKIVETKNCNVFR